MVTNGSGNANASDTENQNANNAVETGGLTGSPEGGSADAPAVQTSSPSEETNGAFEAPEKISGGAKKDAAGKSVAHRVFTVIGIVLCVILVPILVINVTLIIKGFVNKDKVPTVFGIAPMIVLTDSMSPTIDSGDLIIVKTVDAKTVKEGDVISFFDPNSSKNSVITHRVLKENATEADGLPSWFNPDNQPGIVVENGEIIFHTQGDANNTPDKAGSSLISIRAKDLVGVWTGTRFRGLGKIALFLQTTPGLILCIGLPIVLLVGYELIRRSRYDRRRKQDTDQLLAELEALRAAQKKDGGNAK